MKFLREPYYKKNIKGQLKRFDERDAGFSRGVTEGNLYASMHNQSIINLRKEIPRKTILDHSMVVAARTVDYILRKNVLAREGEAFRNRRYKLKNPNPVAITKIMKEIAHWLGVDLVGVTELNPLWVYSHWGEHNAVYTNAAKPGELIDIPPKYNRVIVLSIEMDYSVLRQTPDPEPASAMGYSKMAFCVSSLAIWIRELGYEAIPCVNEIGLSIPMAVDSGLGEMGRNGLLITREFGPRVRIGKVLTDLPLVPDSPIDIGVQRFCEKCDRCAKHCPSKAIMFGPRTDKSVDRSNSEGMLKWPINTMNCLNWWVKNGASCSVCIRVCPWNKLNRPFHRFVRLMVERDVFTRFFIFMDKLAGYGRQSKDVNYNAFQDPSVIEKDCTHQLEY